MDRAAAVCSFGRAVIVYAFFNGVLLLTEVSSFADQKVGMAWSPSSGPYISGYNIHCGLKSRAYSVVIPIDNVTNVSVWGLVEGTTYFFALTARNYFGKESEMSNEVSYSVPSNGITNTNSSPAFLLQHLSATPPANSILRIKTFGAGAISPNLDGKELANGKSYTVTAVPASGQIFAGWRGGIISSSAKLKFVMNPTLVLKADFIPNPYIPVAGNYAGLFYQDDEVRLGAAGSFTASVTSRGTYSARFQIRKSSFSLSGQLDFERHAVGAMKRKKAAPLAVELDFDSDEDSGTITGNLSDTNWTAQLLGDRSTFNSKTNPAPLAGNFTLLIPGTDDEADLPAGDGFGTLRVDSGGKIKFSGALADGTKWTQGVSLSTEGHWPLCVPLYSGNGLIIGWVNFQEEADSDMTATLDWIKASGVKGAFYPAGFTNECGLVGSRYIRPPGKTNYVLNLTNAVVSFTGGNLVGDFTNSVALGSDSRVTNLSSNALKLGFSLSSGAFSGKVTDPSNGKSRSFSGTVLQKQNIGAGYMLVTNQSSSVLISK